MLATLKANLLATVLGLAAAIFLVISVVQSIQINGFLWWDGLKDKLDDCDRDRNELRAELKAISDAKNKQAEVTRGNVEKAEKNEREAKPVADKIRNAPIVQGKCETPGIDILRNEI